MWPLRHRLGREGRESLDYRAPVERTHQRRGSKAADFSLQRNGVWHLKGWHRLPSAGSGQPPPGLHSFDREASEDPHFATCAG